MNSFEQIHCFTSGAGEGLAASGSIIHMPINTDHISGSNVQNYSPYPPKEVWGPKFISTTENFLEFSHAKFALSQTQ